MSFCPYFWKTKPAFDRWKGLHELGPRCIAIYPWQRQDIYAHCYSLKPRRGPLFGHLLSEDPGPPTQLRTQNAKLIFHRWVRRGVLRRRNLCPFCVAGSAEGTKYAQIASSADPKLNYFLLIFGRNLVNADRRKSILRPRRTQRKTPKVRTQKHFASSEDPMQNTKG